MAGPHLQDDTDTLTDEELTELALAADPDTGVAADAVPLSELLGSEGWLGGGDLPPRVVHAGAHGPARLLQGWRRRIVLLVVASFVLINAVGLCSTYGSVGFG